MLLRGLALEPVDRFASMDALADALTGVVIPGRRFNVRRRELGVVVLASVSTIGLGRVAQYLQGETVIDMRDDDGQQQSKTCVEFGAMVERLREERGLTRAQLAASSGLGEDMIGRLERGGVSPSLLTVTKLARGLGMRVSELFEAFEHR
ncbi:helix-turn-helix domain-containing protein [Enhygromyxa salina]|uniref:Anaerobic benzoate catabolism transcriptional regulator n=1 Tax=Enhygromyxa salina TaxID=215803 RepID=A0A2S9YYE4_9BACT|nr:helix-turn-helix transcriptional regulator [Enhygromyxa salina]PRQ10110.1 anaerobic benzoate catabolism transcriptional regulator [Enhygromyxa salina]